MIRGKASSAVHVIGVSHAYPQYSIEQDEFKEAIQTLYPHYQTYPGLQKLINFNNRTQIRSRRTIIDHSEWTEANALPPTLSELSSIFRTTGVELATQACTKAMVEAHAVPKDITHVVAVTCTDQGNPGYDLLVCQKLQLLPNVERTLLHGVGCAGGLSALRAAANIAAAESQRRRPACILVVACELCSLFLQAELQAATQDEGLSVASALFSDAAAALIVCNELALKKDVTPIYQLQEWGSMLIPETREYMSYEMKSNGMIAVITKEVTKTAVGSILPMFSQLCSSSYASSKQTTRQKSICDPALFDWAIHPGGAAILNGAQQLLHLDDDHIRASRDIYTSYGNSSSVTVLIVLDRLRQMGRGRDDVVAASFGPGMMIEMCIMKRWR
ncbi:thiolase-like protein, partial [Phaeosphaeria sp. MPI-PUGE-AT-0046c]